MEEFFVGLKLLLVLICYLIMWFTTTWFITYELEANKWWQRLLIVVIAFFSCLIVFTCVVSERLAKILSQDEHKS